MVTNGWGHVDHWAAERETSWQSTGGGEGEGGGGRGVDKVNTDTQTYSTNHDINFRVSLHDRDSHVKCEGNSF